MNSLDALQGIGRSLREQSRRPLFLQVGLVAFFGGASTRVLMSLLDWANEDRHPMGVLFSMLFVAACFCLASLVIKGIRMARERHWMIWPYQFGVLVFGVTGWILTGLA